MSGLTGTGGGATRWTAFVLTMLSYPCPECGTAGARYDGKPRRCRHLDTMQFTTWIEADVPRMQGCSAGRTQSSR